MALFTQWDLVCRMIFVKMSNESVFVSIGLGLTVMDIDACFSAFGTITLQNLRTVSTPW
jgi:hypothetical protein